MPVWSRLALAHALLGGVLLAERSDETDLEPQLAEPVKVKSLLSSENNICGGPEIWSLVTRDQSPTGVQNIKWKKIDTIANDYIAKQEARVKVIQTSLESLAEQIKQAKAKEHLTDINDEQLRSLIASGAGPFGSLEDAKRTNCGAPQVRPRAPRGSYRKAAAEFTGHADKVFEGSVKLGQAPFLKVCQEVLACESESATCYCERLCQQFRDAAQEKSDANVGEHAGNAGDLVRKQNELQEELAAKQEEAKECRAAREQLDNFGEQLAELKQKANERFGALQDAEEKLYDAQEDLLDLEDDLEKEEAAQAQALEFLKEKTGKFEEATAALSKLRSEELALVGQVNSSVKSLDTARQELDAAMATDKSMAELQELVSVTVMKMEMFFDQAVAAPVRSIGIDTDTDFDTKFVEDPSKMDASGAVGEAVGSMAKFCSEDGKAAIDGVKSKVDLSPLCSFGAVDAVKQDLDKAVADGIVIVKRRLEQVKGWLNPYRGQQHMDDETAEAYSHEGEPAGLRRVISTFGASKFYKSYLKNWKLGGPFLQLLHSLSETLEGAEKAVDEMTSSLAALKDQLTKTVAARQQAEAELEKAAADQHLAQEEKDHLQSSVEAMRLQGDKMKKSIEDLEAQVREAQAKYKEALQKIKQAHEESTSFLQSWQQEEVLEELRAVAAAAHDRLISSQIENDKAQQAYDLASAKVLEIEEWRSLSASQSFAQVSAHKA